MLAMPTATPPPWQAIAVKKRKAADRAELRAAQLRAEADLIETANRKRIRPAKQATKR